MSIKLMKKPEDFVYYRWERKDGGFTVYFSLLRVKTEKKGYIYQALGHNEFEKDPIKVPEEYKLEEPNDFFKKQVRNFLLS